MLFQNNLIRDTEKPNLFNEESNEIFDDEGIKDEEEDLIKAPKIRVLTPVRKKRTVDFKNIFEGTDFKKVFAVPEGTKIDIDTSDEEEVNSRVRKLVSNSGNIDYTDEPEEVKEAVLLSFEQKYDSISSKYPDFAIKFQKNKNLNIIHKNYHSVIRKIYAHMNISQTQIGYIVLLLIVEVACIKLFNIPIAGITKAEMKRMYKYNTLMIEIGEAMYPEMGGEGETQSLEWRILKTLLWNIVIFTSIKLLSNYYGADSMTDTIRTIVDKIFDNNINIENIETGEAKTINKEDNDMFTGLFESDGEGSSEMAEIISSLGSSFTQNMENNRKGPRAKGRRTVIFDE